MDLTKSSISTAKASSLQKPPILNLLALKEMDPPTVAMVATAVATVVATAAAMVATVATAVATAVVTAVATVTMASAPGAMAATAATAVVTVVATAVATVATAVAMVATAVATEVAMVATAVVMVSVMAHTVALEAMVVTVATEDTGVTDMVMAVVAIPNVALLYTVATAKATVMDMDMDTATTLSMVTVTVTDAMPPNTAATVATDLSTEVTEVAMITSLFTTKAATRNAKKSTENWASTRLTGTQFFSKVIFLAAWSSDKRQALGGRDSRQAFK